MIRRGIFTAPAILLLYMGKGGGGGGEEERGEEVWRAQWDKEGWWGSCYGSEVKRA